jgi:GH24 family phage-related lysozyme (muramidase)
MRTAEALRHRAQEQFEEAVLYQSVQEAFIPFSTRFEGRVTHMYLDVKGLVTVGIGNLIDPVDLALALPFVHKQDESPATQDEIRAEWESLKADKDELAKAGWTACTPRTQLKLTDQDLDALVLSKAAQFEATLRSTTPEFASFDSWPADAQLGVLSMAWAMGPAFGNGWPNFRAAVATGDWDGAAANCRMAEAGNPGLVPRNDANEQLFHNASNAVQQALDFSILQYQPPRRTIKAGASGPDVTYLQERLAANGQAIDVTGSFDAATITAVIAFQGAHGLDADGIVGPKTWNALR